MVTLAINLNDNGRPVYCPDMKRWVPVEFEFLKKNLLNELRSGVIIEMNDP